MGMMDVDPDSLDPEERMNKFYALISAAVGLLSLCAALLPICGAGMAIAGLITGWLGIKSEYEKIAIAGIVLSMIGLLTAVIYPLLVQWFQAK
jgi:uncharacterized membrane protein YadS